MHRLARRSSPDLKLRAVESRAGPGEDEAAAAAADVCKLLVAEVVHAEQQQFVKNMVDVLQEPVHAEHLRVHGQTAGK